MCCLTFGFLANCCFCVNVLSHFWFSCECSCDVCIWGEGSSRGRKPQSFPLYPPSPLLCPPISSSPLPFLPLLPTSLFPSLTPFLLPSLPLEGGKRGGGYTIKSRCSLSSFSPHTQRLESMTTESYYPLLECSK